MKQGLAGGGITITSLLGLAFVILKLCRVITWPWLWVLSPFWIPAAIAGVVLIVAVFCLAFEVWREMRKDVKRK